MARRRRIHILATGGTIAGVGAGGATGGYAPGVLTIDELLGGLPRLSELADVTGEQYASLNSDDITQGIWLDMARRLNAMAASPDYDGFVVTHGTDTLEESAYFFHLALKTDKPVIFTGAMRPATATSPDGPLNLYQAVALAASDAARGQGVLVLFSEGIYSARDMRKGNTFRAHAITGGELGSLGLMRDEQPLFYHASLKPHTLGTPFDVTEITALPDVAVAYFHVDAKPEILDFLAQKHDGLVIAGAGDGVVSLRWEARLRALCAEGLPIVRATRVPDGAVFPGAGMPDRDIGTIAAGTLTPEKARVLLMLALAVTRDRAEIQGMFERY
ncbi:MAG: asparaginase [Oscillospiraceae bacterium]|jgi:L-asparaginase|nr:asparaginase [Oscillospiraceae bacterium]